MLSLRKSFLSFLFFIPKSKSRRHKPSALLLARRVSFYQKQRLNIQFRRHVNFIGYIFSVFLSLPHALRQKILYLSVDGAEIILRPGCNGVVELGREPERNLFFRIIRHRLIQAARVDYGLGIMIAAEDYQQIGHHCRLALLIQYHDILLV